jgi:protoheme IX farnesyltransferase
MVLAVLGAAELAWAVNLRTTIIGSTTIAAYLFVYTPLKRYSPLSTSAAAFAGAMPPMIGYAAANGNLSAEAWALAAIMPIPGLCRVDGIHWFLHCLPMMADAA